MRKEPGIDDLADDRFDSAAVLILGASTRAAAQSAVRAGLRPICADLFGDEDLRAVADVIPVVDYPRGLVEAARSAPHCPWMYTGALENHPRLIAAISATRPLLGSTAQAVRLVRNPLRLHQWLSEAGLPAIDVRPSGAPPAADGRWLLKPLRGAAGRGIRVWGGGETRRQGDRIVDGISPFPRLPAEPHFFQRRVAGRPMSAVFVAGEGEAVLVGVSRQLLDEGSADPWRYAGSLGPIEIDDHHRRQLESMGDVLAGRGRLRGLFGIDFVYDGRASWLVEVNPRYTASVEVHEHARGVALLEWHREAARVSGARGRDEETGRRSGSGQRAPACGIETGHGPERSSTLSLSPSPRLRPFPSPPLLVVGKRIVYADHDLLAPPLGEFPPLRPAAGARWPLPPLADLPAPGSRVHAGQPVCTVFAAAEREDACRALLAGRVAILRRLLHLHRCS